MNFWDERFTQAEYVYGEAPNVFFIKHLVTLPPGKILLPGEGEGRNALYAAQNAWEVLAFDSSTKGREKALKLAEKHDLEYEYAINNYADFKTEESFDAIGLFFTHMESALRVSFHQKMMDCLKPGGTIIAQYFNKNQMGMKSGGPQNLDFLLSKAELQKDFDGLRKVEIEEKEEILDEGPYHQGLAHVITLIGKK